VSTVRPDGRGNVIYEIVTDTLQRVHVTVPRTATDDRTAHSIIDAALVGIYARPKPTR
jgi:hypothetical protein